MSIVIKSYRVFLYSTSLSKFKLNQWACVNEEILHLAANNILFCTIMQPQETIGINVNAVLIHLYIHTIKLSIKSAIMEYS